MAQTISDFLQNQRVSPTLMESRMQQVNPQNSGQQQKEKSIKEPLFLKPIEEEPFLFIYINMIPDFPTSLTARKSSSVQSAALKTKPISSNYKTQVKQCII